MTSSASVATPVSATRREWIGLGLLGAASLLVSIDFFVLMLAMPAISASLDASATEQLWILDIYGFLLGGFLVTMGNIGDRIGRRRLLLIGAAAFAVASVLAAFAFTPLMLILARAFLGVAGATIAPSTLALISNMFRDPRQRGAAIGVWMMCFMGGSLVGPLVGGAVLEHFWWGAAFLIGVPVMAVLLVAGPRLLPEYRDPNPGRLDLASVLLSLATILPIVYGAKEIAAYGAGPVAIGSIVIGLGFGVLFVRRQRRLEHPLIDLTLFRNVRFTTAVLSMLGATITGSIMFIVALYLQLVVGLTPFVAGLWTIPAVALSLISFGISPHIARRVRPGLLIPAGLVISLAGTLLIASANGPDDLLAVIVGYALYQMGCGPLITLSTDLVVGSAPPERAGAASAISETSGELGYSLGVAAIGSAAVVAYRLGLDGLPPLDAEQTETVRGGLAGAIEVADRLPGEVGEAVREAASVAYMEGMTVAGLIVAGMIVAIAVGNLVFLRRVPAMGAPEES